MRPQKPQGFCFSNLECDQICIFQKVRRWFCCESPGEPHFGKRSFKTSNQGLPLDQPQEGNIKEEILHCFRTPMGQHLPLPKPPLTVTTNHTRNTHTLVANTPHSLFHTHATSHTAPPTACTTLYHTPQATHTHQHTPHPTFLS